ncbi:hypothetical protein K1719_014859 [Acacia pycnantha]|nr:hypothetical protein K1719_014859 [Acacia pycnantha]
MVRFWEEAATQFQSSTKSHSGASLKLHILLQPYIQRTVLNMASAAESTEKELARMIEEIANLNEEIADLSERIRVIEQNTSDMKESIKEMGGTGKEEGGIKIIKEPLFNDRMEYQCKGPKEDFECTLAVVLNLRGQKYVRELFSRRRI